MKSVGTPGLGYPLLLCLGKSLVVILNYVQQPDPCGPEPCYPTKVPDPYPSRERSGSTTCSERSGRSARTAGGSGPLMEVRIPRESRTPHGVRDPLYSNRTPLQGKVSTPRLGVVRGRHVSTGPDTYIRPLGLHIKAHLPLHSLRQEDVCIDVAEAEAIL